MSLKSIVFSSETLTSQPVSRGRLCEQEDTPRQALEPKVMLYQQSLFVLLWEAICLSVSGFEHDRDCACGKDL